MGQRGDEGGGGVKGVWHFVEVYFAVILLCFQVVSGGNFYGNFFGLMTQDEKVLCRTPSKKRVMATNGNTMDNGYGKEGGRHSAAATMAMGMSMAQRTQSLVLRLEREGWWWQWAMVCVCVFVCVKSPWKIRSDLKKVNESWSIYRQRLAIVKLADNMSRFTSDKKMLVWFWGGWISNTNILYKYPR